MDNCENKSIVSNSDVWKGSNCEEETTDNVDTSQENNTKNVDINQINNVEKHLLNGCEDVDDPLDPMDNCENQSIGSNTDVWKGSNSEEETTENVDTSQEHNTKNVETSQINNLEKHLINGCEDVDDPLDPMDNCENQSIGSNTDVWKGSEEEITENVDTSQENNTKNLDTLQINLDTGKDDICEKNNEASVELTSEPVNDKNYSTEGAEKSVENVDEAEDVVLVSFTPTKEPTENEKSQEPAEEKEDELIEPEHPLFIGTDHLLANKENVTLNKEDEIVESTNTNDNIVSNDSSFQRQQDVDDDCQMDYDAGDDDDFDPLLLCPEVSMAVDESSNESPNEPYEPNFVNTVTGVKIPFKLTPEEQELRKRLYPLTNPIQYDRLHCTACNVHLGSDLEGQSNRYVHPLLKVLICKSCYNFYMSGDFDKDEDGSELYCRWCGQGGQVLCCSKCEFVFCQRCIQTNFGRKKMLEIRDSDSWDCFRCNSSQLLTQRIICYEFFDYIQRELRRAATLNIGEVWTKDYSRCCGNKKPSEHGEEVKKSKKRKLNDDPDYNPLTNAIPTTSKVTSINKPVIFSKPIHSVPRMSESKDNDIEFVRQIPAPQVSFSPVGSWPRYIRPTLPSMVRSGMAPPTLVGMASHPAPPRVPTGGILSATLKKENNSMMKHEWFEKTLRAATRVKSHLSYTLTQLDRAHTQAASVEELVLVHNNVQKILSNSMSALIQIRANLRTEFFAGIKTVRLPLEKADTANNDDNVIFVSASSTSMPMPSTSRQPVTVNTAKAFITTKPAKGFLKMKSVTELQNVPAECITIPDDAPSPNTSSLFCNGSHGTVVKQTSSTEVSNVAASKKKAGKIKNGKITNGVIAKDVILMKKVEVRLIKEDLLELQKKYAQNKQ